MCGPTRSTPWAGRRGRRRALVGHSGLQTGAEPNHVGTDRWQAMASSFHLIRGLEPHLLRSPLSAIDLGPLIYTGAQAGPRGSPAHRPELLRDARSDPGRPPPVPICRRAGDRAHHLAGATLQVDIVPDTESDSLTLEPGETAVWLFRPGAGADARTDRTPPAIAFTAPSPNATVPAQFVATAGATDAKLERIEFFLDGRLISTAKASPYTCACEIRGVKEGTWHGLSAIAHDAAGNVSEARIAVRLGSPSGLDR